MLNDFIFLIYCSLTTTGEGGGTSSGGTSTTWTSSPAGVRPDARQPDAARSLSARHIVKRTEIRNSSSRSASSKRTVSHLQREWQQAHFLGNTLPCTFWSHIYIKRQWLCFSPTMKKPSCQSCWLLGDPSAIQKDCANGVGLSGKPNNFGVKMKSISHGVGLLGHTCPSMVRYQLIMFLSQFNKRCK